MFSKRIFWQPLTIYRYVRNPSRRGDGITKLLKGSVKPIEEYDGDEISKISSYDDLRKTLNVSTVSDELAIESALTGEDDFGSALPIAPKRTDSDYEPNKALIKKKIISRKYFKMDLETNLLTHAAKEQIRYLHRTKPEEWTPENLAKSFPITVTGAKKLLKSNYCLRKPEKIKQHDDEVEERWKALESGEASELISPYTQRMWDEGKIMKMHYKSNTNLPTPSFANKKTVIVEDKNVKGEFSAIIQQYVKYKKEKESSQIKPCADDEVLVTDGSNSTFKKEKNAKQFKFNKYMYHIDDETNDAVKKNHLPNSKRLKTIDETDVLHSQFKINLKDDNSLMPNPQYMVEEQVTIKKPEVSTKSQDSEKVFIKISKHKKEYSLKSFSMHDKTIGDQPPKGEIIKDTIDIPFKSSKRNTLYKVGQTVYDENGQFLYKIPLER